jgi:hypothetical protein
LGSGVDLKGVIAVVWSLILVALLSFACNDEPQSQSPAVSKEKRTDQTKAKRAASSAQSASLDGKATAATDPKPKTPVPKTKGEKPASSSSPAAGTASATPAAPADVRVRTLAEMRKPRSEFLGVPGSSPADRYNPDSAIDWSEIPAWRQTSFFGLRARGQFFVYVVDCSGSMIDDDRFPRATIELRRSVLALTQPQKFEVIFYNEDSIPMPGGPIPRTADLDAKNLLRKWLTIIDPDGGTDPRLAVKQALSLRPDAVFLLSDGAFPDGTVEEVNKLNTHRIPINCVDLAGGLGGDHLKRIAASSGGQYASRPGDLQGRP